MDELCSAMEDLKLIGKTDKNMKKSRMLKKRFNLKRKPRKTPRCWICKKWGHKKKYCYLKNNDPKGVKRKWKLKLKNNKVKREKSLNNQPMRVSGKNKKNQ